MSTTDNSSKNIVFHLLDIQARDMCIESEQDDVREITYDTNSDSDEEIQSYNKKKKKGSYNYSQQKEFVIHLFGSDESGKSIRCDVTGFRPTLYIRLPEEKTTQCAETIKQYIIGQGIPMSQLNFKRIMKKVFYGFTANTFYPFLQIDVPSLTLFRNIRNLFLDENLNPMTKKSLDGPLRGKTIEIFEANIDPMLRFIHTQNIQPCGWVVIKDGASSISEDSESGIIIDCDYEQVLPTKGPRVAAPFLTASWDIECFSMTGDFPLAKRTWRKAAKDILNLATNAGQAADLIIKSISTGQNPSDSLPKGMTPIYCQLKKPLNDITKKLNEVKVQEVIEETLKYGDLEYRINTLEKTLEKTLKPFVYLVGDPVIQIGTTLTRGTPESTENHIFVFPDCAPIPDIIVHSYRSEKAMILAWIEWMVERNPDILIGYNIFGFDESYLWHRAEELGLITSNSPIHQFTRLFALSGEVKLEEKFLSSSALGDNRMYIWTTQGRLQIDLFHYIKRNNVLPSYKLDEVTKHFMSGKLKGQTYSDGKLILEVAGAIKDVKPGRAITLLDDTGETVSPKLVVSTVEGGKITFNCELDKDALNEMEDATKWVIVKDDVSPQDIFRLHRESAEGRAIVAKYCIQDCVLVIDLYKKLETFNNTMCMANVCSVPLSYIFIRGQGIKIESLIFKACRERDILIPVLSSPKHGSAEDSYEGAIVLNPDPGFYSDSPIGVCDFASLYPSTIVSENISHDSLLWIKDFNYNGTLISHNWGSEIYDECEGYAYTDIEFDIWRPDPQDTRKHPVKIKCGRRICRYAQPLDGTKSTLPQITTWLLQAREAKKKEMKGEKDPERYALLDAEQLAYKLTGNSLYGQLGSGTFKIRLQALAASVTAYGRKQILFAKEAIEKFYGPEANDPRVSVRAMAKVVYGDSVTGDTPLLVKNDSELNIITIEDLFNKHSSSSFEHHDTKNAIELNNYEIWTEYGWTKIKLAIKHKLAPTKKLFRIITESGEVDVTEDHSLILANGIEIKPVDVKVGTELLHSIPILELGAGIKVLSFGHKVNNYVKFFFHTDTQTLKGNKILSIEELPHPGDIYVYDLETENHHFAVGPGALIVHNTDSLFVEFNVRNPETGERLQGRDARQATIDITDEAGALITKALAAPHDFEFDKAFDPMLMFSKKRYAGNMYENNADDYVHKYMGIALKRRDNAPIVKTIFGGAMKMLLDKRDVDGAFKFVKDKCLELVEGKVSLGQLTVTKSLRADYANPLSIAHKVLADRITQRDPGNAPAAGDRIGYVYISPKTGQEASKLQGDRIETPLYVKENNLIPDYKHYIEHQLQNPISQAFGLLLERIPGFSPTMLTKCPSKPDRMDGSLESEKMLDSWLAFREAAAAQLLFSDCLKKFDTSSKRNAIIGMFGASAIIKNPTVYTQTKAKQGATGAGAGAGVGTVKKQVQTTMSSFLLDSMIVGSIKKQERATAVAAKKKIKEMVEN
jgi:DNA polymerase elongation subunit (family B)